MPPSLINFDKKGPENQVINFAWPKRRHILFSNIYRSFLYKNKPDPSLFAPKDHLHLNFSGTALLRKKFINIIKHLRV